MSPPCNHHVVYQFIIGVLLVNLLIAMMSDTYARVMEKGRERWTFERASLISEFKDTKPPLPPPFNVLWQLLVELPAKWRAHSLCLIAAVVLTLLSLL